MKLQILSKEHLRPPGGLRISIEMAQSLLGTTSILPSFEMSKTLALLVRFFVRVLKHPLIVIGDGIADDSTAINAAMSAPGDCGRCIGQYNPVCPCESSTITTAMVYFPPGIYRIKNEIILPYNTLAIGDALNPPTILGDPTFNGLGLFNADPYYPGGASWYINQNNFFRQVRNFIFDITELPIDNGKCIHWQVAQATSLQNLVFNMRQGGGSSNKQQGIFMENGSGGFMRDLIFNGGGIAFFLGYVLTKMVQSLLTRFH